MKSRRKEIVVERLIANDPDDCRGAILTLVNNGYIVWAEKSFNAEANKTNFVVCYTKQNKALGIYRDSEVTSTVPFRVTDLCDKDDYCYLQKGHDGPCRNDEGESLVYDDELGNMDEFEQKIVEEIERKADETEQEVSGSCPTYRNGCPCYLPKGHKGAHNYKCADPNCPGYPYPASEIVHKNCKE